MTATWVMSLLGPVVMILVLILCGLWDYFFWAKRAQEHPLSRLAQAFRWAGIALGAMLYFIEFRFKNYSRWFPYAVLLTCLFVLVLVFIPDVSYYLAQAYVRWNERKQP